MCKFIGKPSEWILCKLSKSKILRLYSIIHVAMETKKHHILPVNQNLSSVYFSIAKFQLVMYLSNRSFNMPPLGNPPGIWLFWKLLFKFLPTRAKMPLKCPTLGSIQVIKCPHPGDISQAQKWQKDGGNAFSCRTKSF